MGLNVINPLIKSVATKLSYVAPKCNVQTLEMFEQRVMQAKGEPLEITNILRNKIRRLLPKQTVYETTKWPRDELLALEEKYILEPDCRAHIEAMLKNDYIKANYSNIEELLNIFKTNNPAQNDILDKYIIKLIDGCEKPMMSEIKKFMQREGFKILTEERYSIINRFKYPIPTVQYGLTKNNAHLLEEYLKYCGSTGEQAINLETLLIGTKDIKGISLEQALTDIKRIADIKKADGSLLYNFDYIDHQFSLSEILRCKYSDHERYNEIMQLINLSSEGKITYQPTFFMPKGKLYRGVVDDMRALAEGKSYYPKFNNTTSMQEILKNTKLGDAISIEDRMYVRDADKLVELKITPECYEQLFPAVDRYLISQGQVSTCSGLSLLNNFLQEPKSRTYFYQLLEQRGDLISVRKNLHSNDILTEFNWKNLTPISEKSSKGNPMTSFLECKYNTGGNANDLKDRLDLNSEFLDTWDCTPELLAKDDRILSMRAVTSGLDNGIGSDHIHSLTELNDKTVRVVNPWGSADGREYSYDYLIKKIMNGLIAVKLT